MKEFFNDLLNLLGDILGTTIAAVLVGIISILIAIPFTWFIMKLVFKLFLLMIF